MTRPYAFLAEKRKTRGGLDRRLAAIARRVAAKVKRQRRRGAK